MPWSVYARAGEVILPSAGVTGDGLHMDWSPVHVVPDSDRAAIEQALQSLLASGYVQIPNSPPPHKVPSPVLAAAGVKSWSTLYRGARHLMVTQDPSGFEIVALKEDRPGYVVDEPSRRKLPSGDLKETASAIVDAILDRSYGAPS